MKTTGEKLMCELLDVYLNYEPQDNFRPKWLTNPRTGQALEIDRYYPELKVGYEFQGEYHLRPTTTQQDFEYRKYLDGLKHRLAKSVGVKIIRVEAIDLTQPRMKILARQAKRHHEKTNPTPRRFKKRHKVNKLEEAKAERIKLKPVSQRAIEYRRYLEETYPNQIGNHKRKSMLRKNRMIEHGLPVQFSRKQLDKINKE